MINTTNGPAEVPRGTRESTGHTLNTSRCVEEDLVYLDEEPEVVHVLNAAGWAATFEDGHHEELLFWCAKDDASVHGVAVGEDGRIDLTDSVEQHPGFVRYEQVNNR